MKTINVRLLFIFLISQWGFSQQMPIDFSDSADSFGAFAGSGFAFNTDPTDSSNPVGQFFNDGSQPWQGFQITLAQAIDLDAGNKTITLSFYAFDPNAHNIIVKLENGTNPDVEVNQNTSTQGWTTNISFDFANATNSSDGTSVNASGQYSKLVIFIDGGTNTPGTYLIDDINDGSTAIDPNAIDIEYTDLVWSDEFDGTGDLDNTKWFKQFQLPATGCWFNGEEQHYTNRIDNSFVDNGFLNIVAKREVYTGPEGVTKQYTSARLNSKFAFTYGRIDVRAKLPFGDGTWPAIWTLGKNIIESGAYWQTQGFGTVSWPACGEIDIMEHGLHAVNVVSSAIHSPSSFGNTVNTDTQSLTDVANNFHVYSVNWSPNQITFLIDGVGYYTYNPPVKDADNWPFDLDQYILLNVAMGGISGAIDPNFTQSSMIIDYVRVYQNTLSTSEVNENQFSVYPNPATDNIYIRSANSTINTLELYNSLGQRVRLSDTQTDKLSVNDLESGIYFLKIYSKSNNDVITKKIIVSR